MHNFTCGSVLVLLALALTGCASSGAGSPGTSDPTAAGPSSSALPTNPDPPSGSSTMHPGPGPRDPTPSPTVSPAKLTIVYHATPSTTTTWTLTCAPNGGTHPSPDRACAALGAAGTAAFQPFPTDQACTQLYAGPQTATVVGTYRGRHIEGTFSRNNGCQTARWHSVEGLLPAVH